MSKYLLIDGNNLAMRSIHASWGTGSLSTTDGVPTAALMIFVNQLTKLIADESPTHVAVAWDGTSVFRRKLLPSYKANRKAAPVGEPERNDAFELMRDFLRAAGIFDFLHPEHEADDVIASWWWAIEGSDKDKIVIASGDKDLLQLLGISPFGSPTTVHRFGDARGWDAERFEETNGYAPCLWPLVAALMGDPSDNIEGIKGIGPKKAVKMLREHDWNIIEAVAERFPDDLGQIETNLRLVTLNERPLLSLRPPPQTDLPVPESPGLPESLRFEVLDAFLTKYELTSIQARYRAGQLWTKPKMPGRPLVRRTVAEGRTT